MTILPAAGERSGKSNLAIIDVMRGGAALIVAAFHTREITWIGLHALSRQFGFNLTPNVAIGYLTFPLAWGAIGVPIFFVISGYCIHRAQARNKEPGGKYRLDTGMFYLRRFLRIYPVLFGALLLTLMCDWLSRQYFPNSYKLGDTRLYCFLINLFSVQGIAGSVYGSNLPLWTLSIEVQFYVLYPLLLILMARVGSLRTLGILAIINLFSYFLLERNGYELFSSYYVSWYLGALVAELELAGNLTSSKWIRPTLVGLSLLGLTLGCATLFLSPYFAFQIWAMGFSVFLFAALNRPTSRHSRLFTLFQRFGLFSFSIYIVHMPIAVLIHSILFNSIHQVSILPFFATLCAVVGFAFMFFLIFERPALALSQMFKARKPISGATASKI